MYKDRVRDTTTTGGTGNVTITGTAPLGFESPSLAFPAGALWPYCIAGGSEWETGMGYLTGVGAVTLVRQLVLESSNADALVNFTAGVTKDVFCTLPGDNVSDVSSSTAATMRWVGR